jgi:hypothetical protein
MPVKTNLKEERFIFVIVSEVSIHGSWFHCVWTYSDKKHGRLSTMESEVDHRCHLMVARKERGKRSEEKTYISHFQ